MPVLPIRITGDPVLHSPAAPVEIFDDELRRLVDDMRATMAAAPGVGLAGPQVGVPLRLFVWSWEDEAGSRSEGVAINPRLWLAPTAPLSLEELGEDEEEGCLSIPGERLALRRSPAAILEAVDVDGQPFEVRAEGWLARIFQHEFDHLDGVLYADRLEHAESKLALKAVRKNSWGVPGKSWMPGVDHPEG
jgi:peptide deformylase